MNTTPDISLPERTILVHDWLTGMRGGEKCLEAMCEMFPSAPIYTLLAYPDKLSDGIRSHDIRTSFLQKMPMAETKYRNYLPLFTRAIESFKLEEADLVLSSSHAVAKGIVPPQGALHISYVYTPMRYVWDMFDQYFGPGQVGSAKRALINIVAKRMREWDVRTSDRVHHFIAISEYIRQRIQRHYNRDADVIYPPCDTDKFRCSEASEDYFLVVSALVPYKRVDLAVRAFNTLGLPLRIIGDGPELAALRSVSNRNITFEGWVDDSALADAYAGARALIFPGEEDFGIVPVEAMASGKPVIAYGKGGALETVVHGETGVYFPEQTVESLTRAMQDFDSFDFDAEAIRLHAEGFDRSVYMSKMSTFIHQKWQDWLERT